MSSKPPARSRQRQTLPRRGSSPPAASSCAASEIVAIVPTRRAADGSRVLALPKGHVDPGESPSRRPSARCARRPGSSPSPCASSARCRYWYRRDGRTIGKSVKFFLFSHLGGDIADHDDEVEEVRWMPLREARTAAQPRRRARDGGAGDRLPRLGPVASRSRRSARNLSLPGGPDAGTQLLLDDLRRRAQARAQDGDDPPRRQVGQVPQEPGWCWSRSATSTRRASGSSKR